MKPSREYLGLAHVYFIRRKVFLLVDALETDEYQSIRIERTRVYFDDVLAITYHRERGILFPLFSAFNTIAWGIPAIALLLEGGRALGPGAAVILIAAFFFLAFLLRMILQLDVITVMGRRTNTVMKFWFRKARAQEVYLRLQEVIRARQEKLAQSMPPPPAPPGPPPPAAAASLLPPEPPSVPT